MLLVVMRNIYVPILNISSHVTLDRRNKRELNLPDKTHGLLQKSDED